MIQVNNNNQAALKCELDVGQFIQAAKEQTGLSDFGDEGYFDGMHKLIECTINDVTFHPKGLEVFKSTVMRALVNRLRLQEDLRKHPEILDEDVSDPVIVIGLGRSGTTKLQKMLSMPDDVQKCTFWRFLNPGRFLDAKPNEADPRIATAGMSAYTDDENSDLHAAHHMHAMEVEEDWMLYNLTFEDWVWSVYTPIPSYFDWVMPRPADETYRYAKQILQHLQWQDGGKRDRPWILKSVGHLANIDCLLDCYPNASLVHAHRDPLQTIPSWAKFQSMGWQLQSEPIDGLTTGKIVIKYFTTAMNRYLESRQRLNLDDRILDVDYQDIRSDPMKVMNAIYDHSGRKMSAEAEQAMFSWHNTNEQGKFGKHVYSLEEFGFTEEMINQNFEEYIRRFIKR